VGNFNDEVEGPAPAPEVEGEGPELLALIIPSLVDWESRRRLCVLNLCSVLGLLPNLLFSSG